MSAETDAKLESSLHDEIKARWGGKFSEKNWKTTAFKRYTDNADFAKIAVLKATRTTALSYELDIPKEVGRTLQNQISLESTPKAALPTMIQALRWAVPAKPA